MQAQPDTGPDPDTDAQPVADDGANPHPARTYPLTNTSYTDPGLSDPGGDVAGVHRADTGPDTGPDDDTDDLPHSRAIALAFAHRHSGTDPDIRARAHADAVRVAAADAYDASLADAIAGNRNDPHRRGAIYAIAYEVALADARARAHANRLTNEYTNRRNPDAAASFYASHLSESLRSLGWELDYPAVRDLEPVHAKAADCAAYCILVVLGSR